MLLLQLVRGLTTLYTVIQPMGEEPSKGHMKIRSGREMIYVLEKGKKLNSATQICIVLFEKLDGIFEFYFFEP